MTDWEALYQAKETGWDRGKVSPALERWLQDCDALQRRDKPVRVLVPGCGRGYEVVALAKLGFEVTALDIAPTAIEDLQQALAKAGVSATTICADLFSYKPEINFDVVYEQTCLCAIELEQRQAYEACLRAWLKPQGRLLLSMMQTGDAGGPPFHCDWLDMRQLFNETHWQWQGSPPFVISRFHPSPRFELGYILQRK